MIVGSMGGQEIIRAELALKAEPCQRVSGMIHEATRKPGSDAIQLIKIPNVGDWCAAEFTKVEISAPSVTRSVNSTRSRYYGAASTMADSVGQHLLAHAEVRQRAALEDGGPTSR